MAVQDHLVAVRVGEERHVADTGVENIAVELDALGLELLARLVHVGNAQCETCVVWSAEGAADRLEAQQVEEAVVAELELGEPAVTRLLEPERLGVELGRALDIGDGDGPEVDVLDDQPTEPSICSWIRRFISTAYSSGSSFVIGSTKAETIIAEASVSESPRDIR